MVPRKWKLSLLFPTSPAVRTNHSSGFLFRIFPFVPSRLLAHLFSGDAQFSQAKIQIDVFLIAPPSFSAQIKIQNLCVWCFLPRVLPKSICRTMQVLQRGALQATPAFACQIPKKKTTNLIVAPWRKHGMAPLSNGLGLANIWAFLAKSIPDVVSLLPFCYVHIHRELKPTYM